MSHGRDVVARQAIDTDRGVWRRDLLRHAPASASSVLLELARSCLGDAMARRRSTRRGVAPMRLLDQVKRLRGSVERVDLPGEDPAGFAIVGDPRAPSPTVGPAAVGEAVRKVVSERKPDSILIVGAGEISFPLLAELAGSVVVIDPRPRAVTQLYRFVRARRLPVLPLLADVASAAGGQRTVGEEAVGDGERLRADLVLCPNVSRLLETGNQELTSEHIVASLRRLARRRVVVGFGLGGGDDGSGMKGDPFQRERAVIDALRGVFPKIDVIDLAPGGGVLLAFGT